MELGLGNTLLPGDPRLIDHIVAEVKSQGIFDQFRKECIADVDTKPAYQNLNARVESSVNAFLNKQKWRADLNKNQLRETLRKHIHDAPYLEVGVDRIVDQVVNPKIYSVFMPKIEDVVYKFLGIERPKSQRNGACDLKDLLPTDLDPVSPESDRSSIKDESMEIVDEDEKKIVNGDEQQPSVCNIESKPPDVSANPVKNENSETKKEKDLQAMDTTPVKAVLNTSFKSDEGIKTEEEEEESPDFEPIDIMNLHESNLSNDSHLSGISELTSHRSGSPDFATEFARDNFDCSNQDSQLSKISSNSRLSIVTDIGSSNHSSTPKSDAKEDPKGIKDNFKAVKEFDSNKDSKFTFDVAKIKDNSKTSSSSKESSRDAFDSKDGKSKDESKSKSSKVKHESRSSRDKDRDSGSRHSSKRRYRSRSKDKTDTDSQESKEFSQKPKEIKIKEMDKKDDTSDEISDLKDRFKKKIRELREKMTEKNKLGKINLDLPKDKRDSVLLKDKDEPKKSSHKPSSSRSSSRHSKSSRSSETKESRDKSSSRHEERRHSNGKGESKSSSKSRRDSKSDSRSSDRSRDKKRRDEKKSKPTDDHSSLRKNLNDRRSSDRDGSDGSSSKYSHKTSFSSNTSSSKFGPTSELTKDNKEQHSSGETDSVHDSLHMSFKNNDGLPTKVDPGSTEISLPLKKRRLLSEESQDEIPSKKKRSNEKKALKKKHDQLDAFKSDSDVASVPDEERVQIVEYADEEYDQPYPDKELILSLEETKKIILDAEPIVPPEPKLSEMELSIRQSLSEMMGDHKMNETDNVDEPVKDNTILETKEMILDTKPMPPPQPNLSEMELSIRQSLTEMMGDHKMSETHDVEPVKVSTVMDSSSLLEALTDDSSTDKDALIATDIDVILDGKITDVEISDEKIENIEIPAEKLDHNKESETKVENVKTSDEKIEENNEESIEKSNYSKESETKVENVKSSDEKIEENIAIPVEKLDHSQESETKLENIKTSDGKIEENNVESVEKLDHSKESETKAQNIKISDEKIEENNKESVEKLDYSQDSETKVENVETEKNKNSFECNKEVKADEKNALSIENQLEQFEAFDKGPGEVIAEKTEEKVSDVQEDTEKVIPEIVKTTEINKEHNIEKIVQNFDDLKKVDVDPDTKNTDEIEQGIKNTDEIEQDKENEADFDECNEDDTLIIDEEVDEKEKDGVGKSEATEKTSEIEKVEKSNEKKNIDESQTNEVDIIEGIPKSNSSDVKNNADDELNNKPTEQINNEDVQKLNDPEIIEYSVVKPSEVSEEAKEEIKDQLINDLAKVDRNDSDYDKNVGEKTKESTSNQGINQDDAPIEIIRLDDSPAKSVDTLKMDTDDDSSIDIVEIKDGDLDDKESQSTCDLDGKLNNIPEFDPLAEDSLDAEKSEDINAIENDDPLAQDPLDIEKSDETSTDPLAMDEKIIDSPNEESMEKVHCDADNRTDSPAGEDCRYFDNDKQKYLSFKKYLDELEADATKVTEEKVETPIAEVPLQIVEPVKPLATVSGPLKRKHSPSLIVESIAIKDNNNDGGLTTTKELIIENVSNKQNSIEEPVVVVKKRKVGRMKKSSSSGSVASSTSQPEQPQDKEQQPQAPLVNGENFMMPLSPESDISVSSDKTLGGTLKEERRAQRSSQRYSSDDLYKPRPAFTPSSRRTRRYHKA